MSMQFLPWLNLGYYTNDCLVIVGWRIQPKSTSTRHWEPQHAVHPATIIGLNTRGFATWRIFPVVPWMGNWYTRLIWKWKRPMFKNEMISTLDGFLWCQWLVYRLIPPIQLDCSQFRVIEKEQECLTPSGQSSMNHFKYGHCAGTTCRGKYDPFHLFSLQEFWASSHSI